MRPEQLEQSVGWGHLIAAILLSPLSLCCCPPSSLQKQHIIFCCIARLTYTVGLFVLIPLKRAGRQKSHRHQIESLVVQQSLPASYYPTLVWRLESQLQEKHYCMLMTGGQCYLTPSSLLLIETSFGGCPSGNSSKFVSLPTAAARKKIREGERRMKKDTSF
ncbi:hypothetical protein BX600DRAFT_131841 [Xylariales sp. PMI_506]|nr:hypothetical protein BX600DRAFT_131841 [Xylariales sp. PMI_506]